MYVSGQVRSVLQPPSFPPKKIAKHSKSKGPSKHCASEADMVHVISLCITAARNAHAHLALVQLSAAMRLQNWRGTLAGDSDLTARCPIGPMQPGIANQNRTRALTQPTGHKDIFTCLISELIASASGNNFDRKSNGHSEVRPGITPLGLLGLCGNVFFFFALK